MAVTIVEDSGIAGAAMAEARRCRYDKTLMWDIHLVTQSTVCLRSEMFFCFPGTLFRHSHLKLGRRKV